MGKNGKSVTIDASEYAESLPTELQESGQELDAILDADFSSPTALKIGLPNFSTKNRAFQYYKRIKPQLAGWWQEFSGELDSKTGGPKYKTVHQFARAKTNNAEEQSWIVMMIGQEPAAFNEGRSNGHYNRRKGMSGKWLKVPWLGDWKARRLNGYWAPEHPAKLKSLTKSLKEKLDGFEAVRSAAPFLVQMMARYTRLGEQVDQVFAGQALDMNDGPSEKNKARFYTYLEMQKAVSRIQLRLLHEWMLVHGVSINGEPIHVTQVNNMLVANGQSPIGMADSMTNKDLEAVRLAKMLQLHASNFEMPLPETGTPKKEPEKVKTNGKERQVM